MYHYIFLVDNSYSMTQHLTKILNVINEFLMKLRSNRNLGIEFYFSLALFSNNIQWVIKCKDIKIVPGINTYYIYPSGGTALYDSVSNIILEFGFDTKYKTQFYIITDGDDNCSLKYERMDADYYCQAAIHSGNWIIKHLDTLEYQTLSVPKIQFDINDISTLLENLCI